MNAKMKRWVFEYIQSNGSISATSEHDRIAFMNAFPVVPDIVRVMQCVFVELWKDKKFNRKMQIAANVATGGVSLIPA